MDFYRLTTSYRQFPKRASTSRTSGLRLGRVGIIGWPLQKLLLPPTGQSSKTRFYNMLGKEDQSRKALVEVFCCFSEQTQKVATSQWPFERSHVTNVTRVIYPVFTNRKAQYKHPMKYAPTLNLREHEDRELPKENSSPTAEPHAGEDQAQKLHLRNATLARQSLICYECKQITRILVTKRFLGSDQWRIT